MATETVGIREFRTRLADYISHLDTPVAITRHGQTVGYFIPAQTDHGEVHRAGLRRAAAKLDAMMVEAGFSEGDLEGIVKEFRKARKKGR